MNETDSTKRFSDRVADYRKYRPGYPLEAIKFVRDACTPDATWTIADIGSGTGISTAALIEAFGCPVYAIEPNDNMRNEAEGTLGVNPFFHSIHGNSDDTTLAGASVNLVAAFQAFHWFDKAKARNEFKRILKTPQWVSLIWNDRKTEGSAFLEGYEALLQTYPDYRRVNHKNLSMNEVHEFFGNKEMIQAGFPNIQRFDLEGLIGRFFSSSYTAERGSKEYQRQLVQLKELFDRTNTGGVVEFVYSTEVYLGRMT